MPSWVLQAVRADQQARLAHPSALQLHGTLQTYRPLLHGPQGVHELQGPAVDSSVLQLISSLTQGVDDKHAAILQQSATSVEGIVSPDTSEGLKGKVLASVRRLAKGLLERETEVCNWRS